MKTNRQLIEKPQRFNRLIDFIDVWFTIQGEGPFTGYPAYFIRLAGCNLQCPLCDTNYTKGKRTVRPKEILKEIDNLSTAARKGIKLVVLSGGEPLRQDIALLCKTLIEHGYTVQIETNGTLYQPFLDMTPWGKKVIVVCSPKCRTLNSAIAGRADHFKYVVRFQKTSPIDGLPLDVLGHDFQPARPPKGFSGTVFIQPADEGNHPPNGRNLSEALDSCCRFGYRLSLQTHKLINLK